MTVGEQIDLWGVVVTGVLGIAALAGTFAAVALTIQANRREAARDAQQDRDRVDRWLAEFISAVSDYSLAIDVWIAAVNDIDEHYSGDPDLLEYPSDPPAGRMLAMLDAARLVAPRQDQLVVGKLRAFVEATQDSPVPYRPNPIEDLVVRIVRWRSRELTDAAMFSAIDMLHRDIASKSK